MDATQLMITNIDEESQLEIKLKQEAEESGRDQQQAEVKKLEIVGENGAVFDVNNLQIKTKSPQELSDLNEIITKYSSQIRKVFRQYAKSNEIFMNDWNRFVQEANIIDKQVTIQSLGLTFYRAYVLHSCILSLF